MVELIRTINVEYTRKVGAECYKYIVQYTTGRRVEWAVRAYRDGVLRGNPHGVLNDNELSGRQLRDHIVTLVEGTIEITPGTAK